MVRFVVLALVTVWACACELDELRNEYQINLSTDEFQNGRHLEVGRELMEFLERLSRQPNVHLTVQPFDANNEISDHYKMRERTFWDTPDLFFAQHGVTLDIENLRRLDDLNRFEANTRCYSDTVTFRAAVDMDNIEAHPCCPANREGTPLFDSDKLRVEENVVGTCWSRARVGGRQKWEDRDNPNSPFVRYLIVQDAVLNFPSLSKLAGINLGAPLIVYDAYSHFRIDDIEMCVGPPSVCPTPTPNTTSQEYLAVTHPNARGRVEIIADVAYVPDPNSLANIRTAMFKLQLSDKTGDEDISWEQIVLGENIWRENFLECPCDNRAPEIGHIPAYSSGQLQSCRDRPFYTTFAEPTLQKSEL